MVDRSGRGSRITALSHVLFGVELVGVALTVVAAIRVDPDLATWRSPILLFGALSVTVGWILAWRRPAVPIGWLLLGFGLVDSLQGPTTLLADLLHRSDPIAAGWASELWSESGWTWIPSLGILLGLIPLRFPTGTLPSRRWRWFWWASIAMLTVDSVVAATLTRSMSSDDEKRVHLDPPNPTYVHWGDAARNGIQAAVELSLLVVFVGAVVSLLVRYRRAEAVERAQLRWLFWAVAIVVGLLVAGVVENALFGQEETPGLAGVVADLFDTVNTLSFSLIPVAIMVAVLRSGLYTIDRLISRTASYAVVTVTVVVVYLAISVLGSLLVPRLQSLGVAVATLACAALFLPLLRLLRRGIDRRFDRQQYDAQRVVDAFGERIRTGIDPSRAGEDLVIAAEAALQPTAIGIWLRR